MKNKKKNIYLIILFSAIFIFLREIYYIIIYLYNVALGRTNKVVMMKLIDLRKESNILIGNFEEEKNNIKQWLKKVLIIGLKMKSFDKTTLFAEWFVNKRSHKWVIVVHGYGGNGRLMYYVAKQFYEDGYNVLVPDLRGHGISGASYVGMGWHDRLDIINWIDEIIKKDRKAKIVMYGVSMGASTVIMASGEKLPLNVKCVVADCGYTSAYDVFKYQLRRMHKVPAFPILDIVSIICKVKNGYSLKEASALNQVKKNKLPIFFIHGSEDEFVPTNMVFELYKNTTSKKELMIVNDAGHSVSEIIDRKIYWKRISLFLDKYN